MTTAKLLPLLSLALGPMVWGGAPKELSSSSDLPYATKWGQYIVSADETQDGKERFQLKDGKGRVVQEIRSDFICEVTFPNMDGKGRGDFLKVVVRPQQNTLADIRTFVFSKRGGLHNILKLTFGFEELRDLDGDGRPELISHNAAPFEWIDPVCHGADPDLFMVLKWTGKAYQYQNRAFAKTVREHARGLARELEPGLAKVLKTPPEESYVYGELLGSALGYWACLATIGEEKVAENWLRTRMNEKQYGIFLESLAEMRERLAGAPKLIGKTRETRIVVK
jgi:hypothetical protein